MFGPHPDDLTELARPQDAIREWARNVGWYQQNIGHAWLLHDWDVWVPNPFYCGPDVPHPEADESLSAEACAWPEFAERIASDSRDTEYWASVASFRQRW